MKSGAIRRITRADFIIINNLPRFIEIGISPVCETDFALIDSAHAETADNSSVLP